MDSVGEGEGGKIWENGIEIPGFLNSFRAAFSEKCGSCSAGRPDPTQSETRALVFGFVDRNL